MKKFILLAPILLIGCNINIKKYNPNEVIVIVELRINKDKSELFYGYVDLSEKGDILEAIYNLYNVLHQLNDIDCVFFLSNNS